LKNSIYILYFLICFTVKAQDYIYKLNGDEIKAKVIEITPEFVKYRNFTQPDGPIRNIAVLDVFMIIYADGSREIFKKQETHDMRDLNQSDANDTSKTIRDKTSEKEIIEQDRNRKTEEIYINEKNNSIDNNNIHSISKNGENENEDKYFSLKKNNYFSTAIGYGNSYGGFGIREDFRIGRKLGFGVHAGAGYFPFNGGGFLASIGGKVYLYKALYINVQYGYVGIERIEQDSYGWNYSYHKEEKYTLHGPSVLCGGDWIFGKTFGFNAALGITKVQNSTLFDIVATLDIGFIIKY